MPEITKLGRDGGRIRTQVVWLQISAQEVGVGSTCSAHSRLSRKLVDVKEEGGREESKGRKKESASGQIMMLCLVGGTVYRRAQDFDLGRTGWNLAPSPTHVYIW